MMVASAEEAVGLTELLYKFNALPSNPKVLCARNFPAQRITAALSLAQECICHGAYVHLSTVSELQSFPAPAVMCHQMQVRMPKASFARSDIASCLSTVHDGQNERTLIAHIVCGSGWICLRPRQLRLPVRTHAAQRDVLVVHPQPSCGRLHLVSTSDTRTPARLVTQKLTVACLGPRDDPGIFVNLTSCRPDHRQAFPSR